MATAVGHRIDTGFRGEDRRVYAQWTSSFGPQPGSGPQQDQVPGQESQRDRAEAVLVLEDGRVYTGTAFGAVGQTLGEAVFSTGMSGYQETLTDPSYRRQIVIATAPQIGNTGWNDEDGESRASGYGWPGTWCATRPRGPRTGGPPERWTTNWFGRASSASPGWTPAPSCGTLRTGGSMRAGVFSGPALADEAELLDRVRSQPGMLGADLCGEVSTSEAMSSNRKARVGSPSPRWIWASDQHPAELRPARHPHPRPSVECDLRPDRRPRTRRGVPVQRPRRPGHRRPRGGPDPEVLGAGIPLFGICFGNQILGRALGRSTYKMVFGHRGINVPVIDHATGRVAITAQNHGFALEGEAGSVSIPTSAPRWSATLRQRRVVEGVKLLDGKAFSVQYHPEAAAGPHDANYLFDQFADLMEGTK